MTHEDAGHYAAKHPEGTTCRPEVSEAIKQKISEGKISCAAVHKIANDLDIPPAEVGVAIDLMEARIIKCQLGLFGYYPEKRIIKPAETVSPALAEAIKKLLKDNRLTCMSSWDIAKKLGIPKMDVSSACEAMSIKISSCQIGAFG